jgi:hypothetical protein
MSNRLKPIPKNQSQVIQEALPEAYLPEQGKPISETVFSKNRGTEYSMKDDKVKDISIGLEDIDNAVLYYFNNFIKPSVIQNGQRLAVPVIYGAPERWKSVQADGFYRDASGRIMVPLIMFKRDSIEKNRTLTNKLDGNRAHLYQIVGTKYNKRNAYDQFDVINNRIPSEQYYITNVPDYINVTYNCIIFTDFVEQNNKLVEAIQFASDSYWGDFNRWRFRTTIDTFTTTTLLESGTDRAAKSNFTIKLFGYLIPNTINKDLATARSKFYTKSQAIFTMETVTTTKAFDPIKSQLPLTTTQDIDSFQIENLSAPPTAMGASIGVDSYNINITGDDGVSDEVATYLNTNQTLLATSITTDTATFPSGFAVAPSSLPATSVDNFTFFVNGQLIEPAAILSFIDNGNNTSTLTVDTNELGFTLNNTDEIVAIGKFA